jgi:hypothetical protein
MSSDVAEFMPDEYFYTYQQQPRLSRDELERDYAEAMIHFDWACPALACCVGVSFVFTSGYLRAAMPIRLTKHRGGPLHDAVWLPDVKIWRRYSRGISSYPRRDMQKY